MPLYDYQCEECQTKFEVRASIREKDAGLVPVCPNCQGEQTHQLITSGLVLRSGNGRSGQVCDPGRGPGCCG